MRMKTRFSFGSKYFNGQTFLDTRVIGCLEKSPPTLFYKYYKIRFGQNILCCSFLHHLFQNFETTTNTKIIHDEMKIEVRLL